MSSCDSNCSPNCVVLVGYVKMIGDKILMATFTEDKRYKNVPGFKLLRILYDGCNIIEYQILGENIFTFEFNPVFS